MENNWQTCTLGNLCTLTAGNGFPLAQQGARIGEYPFVKVSDMELGGNEICIRAANHWISEKQRLGLRAKPHPKGSTIFAKIGVALISNRRRFLVRDTIIDNNMMAAIPRQGVAHARYLYYLLCETDFNIIACGTALPYLNAGDIASLEVSVPSFDEQKVIAETLEALDDALELNRRMNRTLEDLSAALFRSWFVDFDPVVAKAAGRQPAHLRPDLAALFPAHWQDSPLGPIPHGWRARRVTEVVAFNPTRRLAKGKAAPYLDMQNVPTDSALPEDWAIRSHGSGMKFQNGDTLMARITPCLENGKTAFVNALADDEVGWGSTEFIVIRPLAPLPLEYGYFLARSDDFRAHAIANMTGSSGRQRVAGNCFEQFLVAEPTKEIAAAFGNITAPFMRMMKANVEESRTLAALRDTLLPKLLSGELRVKPAEKLVEAHT